MRGIFSVQRSADPEKSFAFPVRKYGLPRLTALILALLLVFACTAAAFAKEGDAPGTDPGDTTTIGASEPTGASDGGSASQSYSAEDSDTAEDDAELEKRKEIYTFMTLIALGAIIVGIREKRRRR